MGVRNIQLCVWENLSLLWLQGSVCEAAAQQCWEDVLAFPGIALSWDQLWSGGREHRMKTAERNLFCECRQKCLGKGNCTYILPGSEQGFEDSFALLAVKFLLKLWFVFSPYAHRQCLIWYLGSSETLEVWRSNVGRSKAVHTHKILISLPFAGRRRRLWTGTRRRKLSLASRSCWGCQPTSTTCCWGSQCQWGDSQRPRWDTTPASKPHGLPAFHVKSSVILMCWARGEWGVRALCFSSPGLAQAESSSSTNPSPVLTLPAGIRVQGDCSSKWAESQFICMNS